MEFLQESALQISNNSELYELEAIENFVYDFESTYGTCHVPFAQKSLRQVISENIFSPAETWRVIALYLHHGNDPFAQKWCQELISEETIALLEECFCILPWDISDNSNHEHLKTTLLKYLKHSFNNFFRHPKSGVIFILQLNGVPSVFTILQGNIENETILYTLTKIKDVLKDESTKFQTESEIHEESQSTIGSEGFQRSMFEMLGNRTYDCFEYNQMNELKKKIGFALFGPPKESGYTEKQLEQIDSIFNTIIRENNVFAKFKDQIIIAFIFNCTEPLPKEKEKKKKANPDYNPDNDIGPLPVFVLKKCYSSEYGHGCRIFIDHESRVYTSWNKYKKNNRLEECIMVLPKDGCYMDDENGAVKLEKLNSPACSFGSKVVRYTDTAASGAGLLSGGILLASAIPAITIAPIALAGAAVAGAAAGAVSVVRSGASLIDMSRHGQDTNIITSREARGATLNIAAGSVGILGSGATTVLSTATSRGVNVGQVGRGVVNTLNATNIAIGAAALGNSVYHVYFSWKNGDKISPLTTLQLVTSTLFFANSVYSFRTAATIVEESQSSVLTQMKSELQSNNRRKMFDKMHKETIRMNGGDRQAGNAEVISTIRNIPNKDEIFRILKANNKLFNKNGVKFSASGTEILFNGKSLDLGSFAVLSKVQRLQVLSEMPATPVPQETRIVSSSVSISNINSSLFTEINFVKLVAFGRRVFTDPISLNNALQITLQEFVPIIKEKLLTIAMEIINEAVNIGIASIENFLPTPAEPLIVVLNIVKSFVSTKAEQYRCEYEESKRRAQSNPDFDAIEFDKLYGIHPGITDRFLFFYQVVVDIMVYKGKVVLKYFVPVFNYFMELITAKLLNDNYNETRQLERGQYYVARIPKLCNDCGGYYFVDEYSSLRI